KLDQINGRLKDTGSLSSATQDVLKKAQAKLDQIQAAYKDDSNALGQSEAVLEWAHNNSVYRGLSKPVLPTAVIFVEAWNVSNEISIYEANERKRGVIRAGAGLLSSIYDAVLASIALTEKLAHNTLAGKSLTKV